MKHTGTCQACGRRQAIHVKSGLIAKHGYTTEYSFFNGTCQGSDQQPLELETELNARIVSQLRDFAKAKRTEAEGEILTVPVLVGYHRAAGRSVPQYQQMDREAYEAARTKPGPYRPYGTFDDQVKRERWKLERIAERVSADALMLEELAEAVFGQPLRERPEEAPIQRERFRRYYDAYARVAALKASGIDARQRRDHGGFTVTYRS